MENKMVAQLTSKQQAANKRIRKASASGAITE
jgi:hypothetical protein